MKKAIALLMTLLTLGTAALAVSAATTESAGLITQELASTVTSTDKGRTRRELTEEQKAEFETRRAELQEKREAQQAKWDALTDVQKQSIYALQKQQLQLKVQEITQYKTLGLIDATKADEQIARLNQQISKVGTSDSPFGHFADFDKEKGGKAPRGGSPNKGSNTN